MADTATTQPDETTQPAAPQPSAADTSATVNTDAPAQVDTQSAPNTQQLQPPPPAQQPPVQDLTQQPSAHQSFLGKVLSTVGDLMTGTKRASADDPANGIKAGDAVVQQVNPDGTIGHRKADLHDRIGGALGIAAGAAAGLAAHGPGHLGQSVLLGAEEQRNLQAQKNEQIELQQKGLLQKATQAKYSQDIASSAWQMQREQTAVDQQTSDKLNAMGELVRSDSRNQDYGHYATFNDFLKAHAEFKTNGLNLAQLQAQGRLAAVPTTENGKITGIEIYHIEPVWANQTNSEPVQITVPNGVTQGSDGKPQVKYVTQTIPAGGMTNAQILGLQQNQSKEALDAQVKATQLSVVPSEIKKNTAQGNEAQANANQANIFTPGAGGATTGAPAPASPGAPAPTGTQAPTQGTGKLAVPANPKWSTNPNDPAYVDTNYLASLPPAAQDYVVNVLNGTKPAPPDMQRGKPNPAAIALSRTTGGHYDSTAYITYNKMRVDATSGKLGQQILSMNTGLQHLNDTYNSISALGTIPVVSYVARKLGNQDAAILNTAKTAASAELSRLYKGGVVSEGEQKEWSAKFDTASPLELKNNIKEFAHLVGGKLLAIDSQVQAAMPSGAVTPIMTISEDGNKAYKNITGTDAPGYKGNAPTPQTHVFDSKAWAVANPGQDVNAAIAQAKSQGYQVK